MPTISILIPYFNDKKHLSFAIESVLQQTYTDFELILINHASTDGSRAIAHSYSDSRIKHIDLARNEGAGGGHIFSVFMENARGKYIKTCCADDILLPNCLKDCLSMMEDKTSIDILFGDVEYINEKENKLHDTWFKARANFNVLDSNYDLLSKYIKEYSVLPYIGAFFKKSCMDNVIIHKTMIMMFDMSLWLQLLIQGKEFFLYNKVIAQYRIHEEQISALANERKSSQLCYYEFFSYGNLFFIVKNYEELCRVCSSSVYAKKIAPNDSHLFSFIIAHYIFTEFNYGKNRLVCYVQMEQALNDVQLAQEIYAKFGFGIKELREMYSKLPEDEQSQKYLSSKDSRFKKYKKKMYAKNVRDLSIFEILFVLSRQILRFPFTFFRKRKKDYSL